MDNLKDRPMIPHEFAQSLYSALDRDYRPPQRAALGWRYAEGWYLTRHGAYRDFRDDVAEAYRELYGEEPTRYWLRMLERPPVGL